MLEDNNSGIYNNSYLSCDIKIFTDQTEVSHTYPHVTSPNTWYKVSTKFIATSSTANIYFKAGVIYNGIARTDCNTYDITNTSTFPITVNYTDCVGSGHAQSTVLSIGQSTSFCGLTASAPVCGTVGGTMTIASSGPCGVDTSDWIQAFYTDDVRVIEDIEYCSQTFCLKAQQDCTLLCEYYNDTNAFGVDYTAGFTQYLRLNAQLVYSRYQEIELDMYQYSSGSTSLLYAKSSKIYELAVMDAPEYIHDALRVALLNRFFIIDGIRYVKYKGDYLPIKKRNSVNYGVKVEIYAADENSENAVC